MREKYPFAMTRKSLVTYIVFTVLMGLFLFFVRGDMLEKVRLVLFVQCSLYILSMCIVRKARQILEQMKRKHGL